MSMDIEQKNSDCIAALSEIAAHKQTEAIR
jgi:hypothetical protein